MNKIAYFEKEYTYLKNERLINNLKQMVELLPDYFFEIPATSTGKYHPEFAKGECGLLRHTKAAMRIAHDLLYEDMIEDFTLDEKDLLLMALLFHDGLKLGLPKEKYTRFDHPILAASYLKENASKLTLTKEELDFICEAIKSHMGRWNTSKYSKVTLPLPLTKYQKFVHMCDFLASRKFLDVKFVGNDIIE